MRLLLLLLLVTSCATVQEINDAVKSVQEIRIPVGNDCEITKDGVVIGRTTIMPTTITPLPGHPTFYGVTITTTF